MPTVADTTSGADCYRDRIPGYLSTQQLQDSAVYFPWVLTGRSLLWPEVLSPLMHEFTTTDPGFNRVDFSWVRDGALVVVEIKVTDADALGSEGDHWMVRPLHEVTSTLRARLGMSADDVAAMCGVGRRQLYNLMTGTSAATSQEAHIRRVAELVDQLSAAVDNTPERVRSVVLHPLDGANFFEAAVAQDLPTMNALARQLLDLLRRGTITGTVRRPSPRRRRHARRGAIAEAFGDDGSDS